MLVERSVETQPKVATIDPHKFQRWLHNWKGILTKIAGRQQGDFQMRAVSFYELDPRVFKNEAANPGLAIFFEDFRGCGPAIRPLTECREDSCVWSVDRKKDPRQALIWKSIRQDCLVACKPTTEETELLVGFLEGLSNRGETTLYLQETSLLSKRKFHTVEFALNGHNLFGKPLGKMPQITK